MLEEVCRGFAMDDERDELPATFESVDGRNFDKLFEDAQRKLYPECTRFTVLSFIIKMLHIKVYNKWSNKSFDMVMTVFKDTLPECDETVPWTIYAAKRFLRDLGLGYVPIHACRYDCALFWKEHANLDTKLCTTLMIQNDTKLGGNWKVVERFHHRGIWNVPEMDGLPDDALNSVLQQNETTEVVPIVDGNGMQVEGGGNQGVLCRDDIEGEIIPNTMVSQSHSQTQVEGVADAFICDTDEDDFIEGDDEQEEDEFDILMAPAKKMRRLPPLKRALLEPYSPSTDTCIDYPDGLAADGCEPIGPSLSQMNVLSGSETIAPTPSQTNAPHGFEICEASLSETQAPSPQRQTSGADQIDTFEIGDNYEDNALSQQVVEKKCNVLHKDWKCRMKKKWEKLVDAGTNPYAHPYKGIRLDDWKYLIDEVWLDPANKRRYDTGKKNRSKLPYNHTSGSRSFPAAMSIAVKENGGVLPDLCNFYKHTHQHKRTKQWIDPICEQMTRVRDESIETGTPMRQEDISRVVLGKKKGYLRGFGVGPKPSSCDSGFSAASQARDEQLKRLTSELEILRAEQQRNREEQQKKEEE
ncbi:unnamed protein product [Camellia sinensis]